MALLVGLPTAWLLAAAAGCKFMAVGVLPTGGVVNG